MPSTLKQGRPEKVAPLESIAPRFLTLAAAAHETSGQTRPPERIDSRPRLLNKRERDNGATEGEREARQRAPQVREEEGTNDPTHREVAEVGRDGKPGGAPHRRARRLGRRARRLQDLLRAYAAAQRL